MPGCVRSALLSFALCTTPSTARALPHSLGLASAQEKKAKLPAAIAKAGKEELQKMLMDTLKKLKIRDKKLTGTSTLLQQQQQCV